MVGKVLAGFFIVGITGTLAYGAWNRTTAKLESSEQASVRGQNAGYASNAHPENVEAQDIPIRRSNGGQGGGRAGQGGGQGSQGGGQGSQGGGQDGQGGRSAGQGQTEPPEPELEGEMVVGVVSSTSEEGMSVTLENGEEILIEGRTWMFIQEKGFFIELEDQVLLRGFNEDGEFKLVEIENLTTTDVLSIREPTGRPLWAGGGRQNS